VCVCPLFRPRLYNRRFFPSIFSYVIIIFILLLICFLYFLPAIPKGKKKKNSEKKHRSFTCGRDGDRLVFKESGSVWWSFYFDSDSNHRLTDQPEIFVSPSSTTPRTRQFQHGSVLDCLIHNISVRLIPHRWSSLILDTTSRYLNFNCKY